MPAELSLNPWSSEFSVFWSRLFLARYEKVVTKALWQSKLNLSDRFSSVASFLPFFLGGGGFSCR
jgi:hypothetical protein